MRLASLVGSLGRLMRMRNPASTVRALAPTCSNPFRFFIRCS